MPFGRHDLQIIYEWILGDIRRRVDELGIASKVIYNPDAVPWTCSDGVVADIERREEETLTEITYVDDDVCMLDHHDPEHPLRNGSALLTAVTEEFNKAGVRINLAKGKSDAMVKLMGKGSQRAKRSLFRGGECLLHTCDGSLHCHVVDAYKHVGTIKTSSGNPLQDARARQQQCMQAYVALAHRVFANSGIAKQTPTACAPRASSSALTLGGDPRSWPSQRCMLLACEF